MVLIDINNAQVAFGENEIIKNVTLQIKKGERIGITGENGAGKSTLFKAIVGINELSEGSISLAKGLRIGYLEQQHNMQGTETVLDEAKKSFLPLFKAQEKMQSIQEEMANQDADLALLGEKYEQQSLIFESLGGYSWESRLAGVLKGLGLTEEFWDKSVCNLSGGEKTRLALAKMLLEENDVLLLDEPTNHLDLAAAQWLTDYLARFSGTVMLISHDRYMLDKLCTSVAQIEDKTLSVYKGNYTDFCRKYDAERAAKQSLYEKQQDEIKRQKAIIARYRSFNREKSIRAAESREKVLAKMELVSMPTEHQDMRLKFEKRRESGNDVFKIENLSKTFGEKVLFKNFSAEVKKGQKIAIIGANGCGKTTLMEIIAAHKMQTSGTILKGVNVDLGYYEQTNRDFMQSETVMDMVWRGDRNLNQTQIRSRCAAMLFFGEDVFKEGNLLSGGERARCALCSLSLKGANTLLLDEPTNHLDMDSREILEDALEEFSGTVIAVSHDRYFINRIFDTLWIVENGTVKVFSGKYDDYLALLRAEEKPSAEEPEINKTRAAKQAAKERQKRDEAKKAKIKAKELEKLIEDLEAKKAELEQDFANPEIYLNTEIMLKKQEEYNAIISKLDELMEKWLEVT